MRRRCLGAWLTWMCLTTRLPVSRPLASALASAFLRRPRRNSADLTGQRARVTPNCLPVFQNVSANPQYHLGPPHVPPGCRSLHSLVFPVPSPRTTCVFSSRTLGGPADRAAVAPHGDGLLLLKNVLEEGLGALELPAVDRLGGLAGVLERHTEVRPAGASRLRRGNLSRRVPNLYIAKNSGQPGPRIALHRFPCRSPISPPTLANRAAKIPRGIVFRFIVNISGS